MASLWLYPTFRLLRRLLEPKYRKVFFWLGSILIVWLTLTLSGPCANVWPLATLACGGRLHHPTNTTTQKAAVTTRPDHHNNNTSHHHYQGWWWSSSHSSGVQPSSSSSTHSGRQEGVSSFQKASRRVDCGNSPTPPALQSDCSTSNQTTSSTRYQESSSRMDGPIPPAVPNPDEWGPFAFNTKCLYDGDGGGNGNGVVPPIHHPMNRAAPYAVLLGVMKGGTKALMGYLAEHANVAASPINNGTRYQEIHYFDRGINGLVQTAEGIPQRLNQERYQSIFWRLYGPDLFLVAEPSPNHRSGSSSDKEETAQLAPTRTTTKKIAIDDTPYLLTGGDRIARALLCVAPWTKWIVLLRNPVDRIDSQYRYLNQGRQRQGKRVDVGQTTTIPMVDWETWIRKDIQLLQETGVVQDWNKVDFDQFSGSDQEREAWNRYVMHRQGCGQIVGKSLYAIPLQQYYQAMDEAGKPRSHLLVMASEQLRRHTQHVYNQVLEHLELPPHVLTKTAARHATVVAPPHPMPRALRRELKILLEPYNRRLFRMLGWNRSIWEDNDDDNDDDDE
ncbi:hypothetical protein ACA910_004752 [Epithemia clementina (nom. ined.)]